MMNNKDTLKERVGMKRILYKQLLPSLDMKRGQITLFVIIGLLIVSAVLIFFLWIQPTFISGPTAALNLEGCISDAIIDGVDILEKTAGFQNPQLTYPHQGDLYTYLCYTNQDLQSCTVQVPFLKTTFEEELSMLIRDDVDSCYDATVNNLRDQGYEVVAGQVTYEIEFNPGVIQTTVYAPTTVGQGATTQISVVTNSPVYELTQIATSIVQFEIEFGDYDAGLLPILYPEMSVQKLKQGDGTSLYILTHKTFGNEFRFASRSLVWPVGYYDGA